MIGLDANVVIRHLTQDDPRQSPIASSIIEQRLTEQEPGFISIVALVEIAWVLESRYGATTREVADAAEALVVQDALVVEDHEDVVRAIEMVRNDRAEFSDALIMLLARRAGCSKTLTFDKRAAKLSGFKLV